MSLAESRRVGVDFELRRQRAASAAAETQYDQERMRESTLRE